MLTTRGYGLVRPLTSSHSVNLEKVYLISTIHNNSKVLENQQNRNLSGYHEYVNDSAKDIGCKLPSDEFVKLNGISSEKVAGKSGPNEEYSMLSYGLGSAKNIIFVGLKGPTDAFNYNYRTFMKSLNTIEIDEKSDIEELISKSYPPD